MSDTMQSRLRRAVQAVPDTGSSKQWADDVIRLFLTELREPTREMYLAPNWTGVKIERDILPEDVGKTVEFGITGYEATDIWQAMIDVLLQQPRA